MTGVKQKSVLKIGIELLTVASMIIIFIAIIPKIDQVDNTTNRQLTNEYGLDLAGYNSMSTQMQNAKDIESINAKGIFGVCLAIMALTLIGFVIKTLVALYLSEDKFSKAFNSSPMMISITSFLDGRYIEVNDSFCRSVGYRREEILGHTALELGISRDISDTYLIKQGFINSDVVRDIEMFFYRKNQEQRLASYSAERIDIGGESCILSILSDITEQKQMEIEMFRLDRLALVGEMAAGIGHEIRNPMTTVRGFLQIMKDNKEYLRDKEYFDLMIEELDRANSIITEFLSLAKNKMVELRPANLKLVLTNILPLLQANAMIQDQCIKLELEDVPELLLDEKEIRQLVLNLVRNGLESMNAGGVLTIRTFAENETVVLAIKDQGYEINPELLEKLGTPFFTTKEQGTGLGLAVCYGIATRHNAKIDIETSSNGSTFYVRFPNVKFRHTEINTIQMSS